MIVARQIQSSLIMTKVLVTIVSSFSWAFYLEPQGFDETRGGDDVRGNVSVLSCKSTRAVRDGVITKEPAHP
jgi:hypothetical protein